MSNTTWEVPHDLITTSVSVMRPHGRRGCEGIALWGGMKEGSTVHVTHALELVGPGLAAGPLHLKLSLSAMCTMTDFLDKAGLYWVGQIHSHPGMYLDLSEVDCDMGVKVQDYLSLVCPYYAQRETTSVDECGVHLYDRGAYRRMSMQEASRRVLLSRTQVVRQVLEVAA